MNLDRASLRAIFTADRFRRDCCKPSADSVTSATPAPPLAELLYDEMVACLAEQAGHHAAAAVGASSVHDDNMMAAILNNNGTCESSATVFICAWGRYE